jgi:hypothetical protein
MPILGVGFGGLTSPAHVSADIIIVVVIAFIGGFVFFGQKIRAQSPDSRLSQVFGVGRRECSNPAQIAAAVRY